MKNGSDLELVILFVRMWVEMFDFRRYHTCNVVILFVRMWVEISLFLSKSGFKCGHPLREDVSWNLSHVPNRLYWPVILFVRMWVEIPHQGHPYKHNPGHPLREDVSWNNTKNCYALTNVRHPLREDVSWNREICIRAKVRTVILFVRMWVEIIIAFASGSVIPSSSSSWGCELKCRICENRAKEDSHPLREDVSWNKTYWSFVITLSGSSSSWGCELKFLRYFRRFPIVPVILFVRMWVEIFQKDTYIWLDVVILFVRMWVEIVMFRL